MAKAKEAAAPAAVNDGGFWYPRGEGTHFADRGATVRDMFAFGALSILAGTLSEGGRGSSWDGIATRAYALADAMIAKRLKDYRGGPVPEPVPDPSPGPELPWVLDDEAAP